jgi:hypothetical protein
MTIEAWVRPETSTGWRTVVLKEDPVAGDLAYSLYGGSENGGPGTWVRHSWMTTSSRSTRALPVGQWTHIAATYDGTTLTFYRNGKRVAYRSAPAPINSTGGLLRIGGNDIWDDEDFHGAIDDVRIYDRALTGSQITADMSRAVG